MYDSKSREKRCVAFVPVYLDGKMEEITSYFILLDFRHLCLTCSLCF